MAKSFATINDLPVIDRHYDHTTLSATEYVTTLGGWVTATAVGACVYGTVWAIKNTPAAIKAIKEAPSAIKEACDNKVNEALKATKGDTSVTTVCTKAMGDQKAHFTTVA